ncbi:MAG TPA: hypothetical protein VEB67_01845 [Nitrososphaerales archaeon]|nr:hypothetical protein [Nitrososphaerales archaeon]
MQETVSSILDSLQRADLEGAKKKIQEVSTVVRSERERGNLMAAYGIYSSMTKGKEGRMQTWDSDRLARAARTINSSQLADDFDVGYAETLLSYSALTQRSRQPEA